MALTLSALKTELTTDPNSYGYSAAVAAGAHGTLAALLNQPRAEIAVKRTDVSVADIYAAVQVSDYSPLAASPTAAQLSAERRYVGWLSGLAALGGAVRIFNDDGSDTPVAANLKAMFPAGTGTLTRLATLATRPGSRAEQLFGRNTTVGIEQIALALAL